MKKHSKLPSLGSFLEGEDSVPTSELRFSLSTIERFDNPS